jgi:hypothetical protein
MGYMKTRGAEAMGDTPPPAPSGLDTLLSVLTLGLYKPTPPTADITIGPATVVATAPSGPPPGGCGPGLVYEVFYDSCVTPCPPGQTYNHSNGICEAAGMPTTTMLAIGVGGVAAYLLLTKKKRRNPRRRRR